MAPNFQFPLCGCFADMNICCHTCWCWSIRAADTHQAAATEKYWTVILWWVFSLIVGSFVGGSGGLDRAIAGLMMAAIMTSKRQALRARLGIAPGSSCEDFFTWWCCAPCVVAQEAREVDHAAGVSVKCCCSLGLTARPQSQWLGRPWPPFYHQARCLNQCRSFRSPHQQPKCSPHHRRNPQQHSNHLRRLSHRWSAFSPRWWHQ